MGDILNTAVSGLLSYQRALSTTSHNISNVNTEGYSRQSVDLEARNPSLLGGNFVGNGVQIDTIQRAYDYFITNNVRESNSSFYRLDKFTELASDIDNLLADPEGGISPILQEFFTSVQDIADDPASGSARSQLLSTAESLVNRFSTFDTRLDQLASNVETDIRTTTAEINQLAAEIASINTRLEETNASTNVTQQSSDLLDQRDALLAELSTKVNIQVINEPQNYITVLIGNGQTMVSGANSFSLNVQANQADPTQNIIVYSGFTNSNDISQQLNGGELGGLLDYRSNVLNPARNSLGRVAIGLADSFNDQHNMGMDLNDTLGGDFFTFRQPAAVENTANTGTASITTTITDVSQLTVDDYTLTFDGPDWTITSTSGSSAVIPAAGGSFEGLTFVIGAGAVAGDSFSIKPTIDGAESIDLAITDANLIAAAAPVRSESSLSNLGDAEISQGIVTDATDPALLNTVTITFNGPPNTNTFDVFDETTNATLATNVAYTNNMNYSINGWEVTLNGNPAINDQFTIEANFGGTGDNRNALALTGLQTTGIFDNGSNNFQEAYSVLVGKIGSVTHSAEVDRDAQGALLSQAEDRRSQVAGVNLDEEAADLVKYQQAYEAAARIITTAQTMFNTLLDATR